ncbi:MAG: hypothetical protein P0Y56_02260 [Candidatus Andeanibacterium colombiense]|uniref:Uncharacterized protein n=1 Tax=Candidatus Andeanibacterium colombiense TaxID=3121345 RepID=A0AAJ5X7H1_9SPHN|nr:MAG: hypothetical protein P0Y56_02260 [Sphingomonadaceae bacterium]
MVLAALLILAAQEAPAQAPPCLPSLPNATLKQSAWGKSWYLHAESIEMFDHTYVKYGLPRNLRPGDLDYAAEYMGVAVALDRQAVNRDVIYLLTNAETCEFQPFQIKSADPG